MYMETYIGNIVVWKHHLHLETKKKYIGNIHSILPIFQYHIGNIRWILETHILETYTV